MRFTQKEKSFLKDLKEQEQLCMQKYDQYASDSYDEYLADLFSQLRENEQQHLDTIVQIMKGKIPVMQSGGGNSQQPNLAPTYDMASSDPNKEKDSYLCNDSLSTEKHVSSLYNTSVFEFRDPSIRNALNHIQKEEQQHGEQIYNYMSQNGMYS